MLILGSGNIVHNLYEARPDVAAYEWARSFDETARRLIVDGDHQALIDYRSLGGDAQLAIPTNEHYLPLLYVLAQQLPGETPSFWCEEIVWGSISMRAVVIA